MNDEQLIAWLNNALARAVREQNWRRLGKINQQIAILLNELSQKTVTPEIRQALLTLRQTYQDARDYCRQHSELLEQKMAQARSNRDGVAAYAVFAEDEEGQR